MPLNLDENCPWCGAVVSESGYVLVHGHYECTRCHRPVLDCCDGEQEIEVDNGMDSKEKSWWKSVKRFSTKKSC